MNTIPASNASVSFISTPIKRNDFFESLETYTSLSKSSGKLMALVLINIENFDQTNKSYGYGVGEEFINSSFRRVEVLAKFFNCAFRINDSMFALILPVVSSKNMLALAANKILDELKETHNCSGTLIKAETRIGMAVNDQKDFTSEALYKKAQAFLHTAEKQSQPYVLDLEEQQTEEIENFAEKFTTALNSNEFELYYQPKTHLLTGKTTHVEALLRWKMDGERFISPEVIVAQAEKSTEQNFSLTKWVVNAALRQLREWLDQGLDIRVSVNVSASLIHRNDLVTMIEDALSIWSVPAERLTIEITETAIMTNKALCHDNLNSIRESGMHLSIDDFGTGYSSLSYFKQIPANELKIDKSFILNLMESNEDRNLVRLMIKIGHSFNLQVVAEGIESKACYDFLQEIGCDYAQGYFIAKPQPAKDFTKWINER